MHKFAYILVPVVATALSSCGGDSSTPAATTTTTAGTTTTPAACTISGNNVFVPNNGTCDYNGNTATCTNGSISYMGLNAGTSITLNGTTFSCL